MCLRISHLPWLGPVLCEWSECFALAMHWAWEGGVAVKSLFCWNNAVWFATGMDSMGLRCRVGRTSGKDWGWV